MRKARHIVMVLLAVLLIASCATALSPTRRMVLGTTITHDAIVVAQNLAAVARVNYLDSFEVGFIPNPPYLDDETWLEYEALEKKIMKAQDVYVDVAKLLQGAEIAGEDARVEFYLSLIGSRRGEVLRLFNDIAALLSKNGINLEVNLQ